MARPREFEPAEALEKAMLQFWASGYHDTSIRELTARTGVNQYGLYGTFKSKHGLYIAALDHYRNTVTREFLDALMTPGPLIHTISTSYGVLMTRMRTEDGPVGCLIANAAVEMAPDDGEAAQKVRAHMRTLKKAFRSRLSAAVADGDLTQDSDITALAEFLATTAYTLGFLLRAGCSDAQLKRHVATALKVLG